MHSHDVDPVYRLVPQIIGHEGFEPEWFVFVYCAYYSLASAVHFCRRIPEAAALNPQRFADCSDIRAFGVERRGSSRAPALMYKALDGYRRSLAAIRPASEREDHDAFQARLRVLPLQGPWAAFKLTELFEKALERPNLAPTSMGISDRDVNSSRGPQGGCRALYSLNSDARFEPVVAQQWEALGRTLSAKLGYDLGEIETALCKWAKLCKGQYFIGHDIHEMKTLQPLWGKEAFGKLMHRAGFKRRLWAEAFDVRRAKGAFAREGVLINREFANYKLRLA